GRVLEAQQDRVTIGDAFGVATAFAANAPEAAIGDHVVVEGGRIVARFAARSKRFGDARSETARLLHRGVGANLVERAGALRRARAFFDARDFLEVETPAIVPSPGLDLHLDAFAIEGAAAWLVTSP